MRQHDARSDGRGLVLRSMETEAQSRCFEPGFRVAVRLRPGTAPIPCYVGEVVATDEHGVRLTLVDWIVGGFVSHDMYVPWTNIEMAYVATPNDTLAGGDRAGGRRSSAHAKTKKKSADGGRA